MMLLQKNNDPLKETCRNNGNLTTRADGNLTTRAGQDSNGGHVPSLKLR